MNSQPVMLKSPNKDVEIRKLDAMGRGVVVVIHVTDGQYIQFVAEVKP